MKIVSASASTRAPRLEVIDDVRTAAAGAGAWLLDFEHYSNLATVLRFDVDGARLPAVRDALAATRAPATFATVDASGDVLLTLRIDFIHDDAPLVLPKPILT